MPKYDLSTYRAISEASESAKKQAASEPGQSSYNAAWLHGYASALADATAQLEPQQRLIDTILNYLGEHNDSSKLYQMLHEGMDLTDDEISLLGFDLPHLYQAGKSNPAVHEGIDMNSRVKDWYEKTYPTDELGSEINNALRFADVVNCLNRNEDVYNVLNVIDSIVRERVFDQISQILHVSYDVIYEKWLLDENAPDIPFTAGPEKNTLSDQIQSAESRIARDVPADISKERAFVPELP